MFPRYLIKSLLYIYLIWYLVWIGFTILGVAICYALRDLVLFVQFKKREKHSWVFSRFLYCANGNKSRKASLSLMNVRHDYFKNSFFPTILSDRYKLDLKIGNSASLSIFENNLPNFIRLCANSIFDIHNSHGIKLLIRLRPSLC